MIKSRPEFESDRYAAVYQISDKSNRHGAFDAVAYGPEEDCWVCEQPGCKCWELYEGDVSAEEDGEFDEHAAVATVSDCRSPHDWEPRDAAGKLMRP